MGTEEIEMQEQKYILENATSFEPKHIYRNSKR